MSRTFNVFAFKLRQVYMVAFIEVFDASVHNALTRRRNLMSAPTIADLHLN